MALRTVREFKVPLDVWKFVDEWATEENFEIISSEERSRLYRKTMGPLSPSAHVEISEKDGSVHLEAWLANSGPVRALRLFTLPPEVGVESNGTKALAVARTVALDRINRLLVKLGQPLIS